MRRALLAILGAIAAIALLIVVFAIFATPQPTNTISYSEFVSQARSGNVSAVQISGSHISGTFNKPVETWNWFQTTFPQSIGDTTLLPLLQAAHVEVVASEPSGSPWWDIVFWLPVVAIVGFWMWSLYAQRNASAGGPFTSFTRAKPQRYKAEGPAVTFDDVAGADEAKEELQEEVDFLQHPQKYRRLGATIPKGILLVGAPGTGKTLLARAVAGQAGATFLSLNASEFVEMFVGVGASRVRDLFAQAKAVAPAIVFIDELDAVGRRRGAGVGTVNDEREQTLNQLLAELDGFDKRYDVIILAATNRPDVLDPALLRPGRFDRQVALTLPDRAGREGILRIHTRKLKTAKDVDVTMLSKLTIGQSGADIANLCNESALIAARHDHDAVAMSDFEEAQDKLRLGIAHPHLADPQERRVIAAHESGHALVAWLTPDADPVQKVMIIPHGQALGQTQQIPGEERHNLSFRYLQAKLGVLLAGRSAEEVLFDELSTGAENDLVEATQLARRMVSRWGMGELGLFAVNTDEEQPFLGYEITRRADYSDATAARIDEDVQRLLNEAHENVKARLQQSRELLDRLVDALLGDETLSENDLARILGPRAVQTRTLTRSGSAA